MKILNFLFICIILINSSAVAKTQGLAVNQQEINRFIEVLKIIKKNYIHEIDDTKSINDALVLKEAEIARLKSRIGVMERKKMISELNNENLDEHHKI